MSGHLAVFFAERVFFHVYGREFMSAHMLEGGADIRFIQQLLGHESLDTTSIYTEVAILQLQVIHAKTHPTA